MSVLTAGSISSADAHTLHEQSKNDCNDLSVLSQPAVMRLLLGALFDPARPPKLATRDMLLRVLAKAAVDAGWLTQGELEAVLGAFRRTLTDIDPCSVGRVRSCTLLPLETAAEVARAFGGSEASTAFLRAFEQPVPPGWDA